jgi:hypothetical protein
MAYSIRFWAKARIVFRIVNHGLKAVVREQLFTPFFIRLNEQNRKPFAFGLTQFVSQMEGRANIYILDEDF